MPEAFIKWRVFWLLWLTGLALFVFIVATNSYLVTPTAPAGIIDHQSAATAARVNAIHASWKDAGVNGFATTSMLIDLLFITLYALGGLVGSFQLGAAHKAEACVSSQLSSFFSMGHLRP